MDRKRKQMIGGRHLSSCNLREAESLRKGMVWFGEISPPQFRQPEVELRCRQDPAPDRSKAKAERLPGNPPAGTSLRLHRCSALPVFL